MKPSAIIGALIGAVVGAGLWGGIAWATGYEIGIVAWLVGGIVGFGAFTAGGEGVPSGVVCAGLALVAIFGGKMLAVKLTLGSEIDKIIEQELNTDAYNEMLAEGKAFTALTDDSQHADFMVRFGYTEAERAEDVEPVELNEFREESAPYLRQLGSENPPSLNEWRNERSAIFREFVASDVSLTEAALDGLGLLDIVFGLLGIVTAFKVGSGMQGRAA